MAKGKLSLTILALAALAAIVPAQADFDDPHHSDLKRGIRSPLSPAYQPTVKLSKEDKSEIPGAEVQRDATGQIRRVRGRVAVPGAKSRSAAAWGFLRSNAGKFNLSSSLSELRIEREFDSPAGHHVVFEQRIGGAKVFGGHLGVHLTKDLAVHTANLDLQPVVTNPVFTATPSDPSLAIQSAIAAVPSQEGPATTPIAEAGYLVEKGTPVAAWRVAFDTYKPAAAWEVFVDANTNAIISKKNIARYATGSGLVYEPNPMQTTGNAGLVDNLDQTNATLDAERKTVSLLGITDGQTALKGQYAWATLLTGDVTSANLVFNFNRSQMQFNAVMSYYHIDKIERHIQSLGFNNIQNRQVKINVDGIPDDQSFYSPATKEITMGSGGVDDAEDADIIWHEAGHAIHDNQVPGWGGSHESGAMGEGFGDYWAASAFAGLGPNRSWDVHVGEWDGSSYSNESPPRLRSVDSTKHYPEAMTGNSVHSDGEIWSASLWQVRTLVGRTKADKLVLQSHFLLSPSSTFADAANAIITANEQLYNNADRAGIRQIFVNRGILGPETPTFTISGTVTENGGGLQGATVTLSQALSGEYKATANPNAAIPDNNTTGITSELDVPVTATMTGVKVDVNIAHTYRGDVGITLIHPDNTQVVLKSSDNDSANDVIQEFNSTTTPGLSALNGKPAAGVWKLKVTDSASQDTGTLRSWSVRPQFTSGTLSKSVTTPVGGAYSFAGLSAGTYTVTPTMTNKTFTPANRSVTVGPDMPNQNFASNTQVQHTVQTLTANPTTLVGGNNSAATVTISPAAGAGGEAVSLSDNSAAASQPATVTVAQAATSANFTIQTFDVSANTTVAVTATADGTSKTVNLTLTPGPALNALTLTPTTVEGGQTVVARVFLVSAAPTNGAIVNLTDNTSVINTPPTATVNGGNQSAAINLTTSSVSSSSTRQVTATRNGVTKTANLTLTPGAALTALSLNPSTVTGGSNSTGTVTLSGAATGSGAVVSLTDNTSAINTPASVTVTAGNSTATFTVTTSPVTASATRQVSASRNGVTKTANLTLNPGGLALASLTINPSTVKGGTSTTGTVTLTAAAPAGGIVVTLSDNTSVINTPPSTTVAQGTTSKSFTLTTSAVTATATRQVTATHNGVTKTANLTLTP